MISLLFKFFGDSTPLKQEAEKAKTEMAKAGAGVGQAFGSQFKSLVMSSIGIGAIAGLVKNALGEVSSSVRATNVTGGSPGAEMALKRASEATGLSREQILDTARSDPEKFKDFIKQFEGPMSDDQMKSVASGMQDLGAAVTKTTDSFLAVGAKLANLNVEGSASSPVIASSGFSPFGLAQMPRLKFNNAGALDPIRAFSDAASAKTASDDAFNKMVDNTNKMIEEQQKTRAAIERN